MHTSYQYVCITWVLLHAFEIIGRSNPLLAISSITQCMFHVVVIPITHHILVCISQCITTNIVQPMVTTLALRTS